MVFIHVISEEWTNSFDFVDGTLEPNFFIYFIFYFGTLGGVFYFMMAAVLTFNLQRKFSKGKAPLNYLVVRGVIKCMILKSLHYIFRPLFSFINGEVYHFIRDGVWGNPTPA